MMNPTNCILLLVVCMFLTAHGFSTTSLSPSLSSSLSSSSTTTSTSSSCSPRSSTTTLPMSSTTEQSESTAEPQTYVQCGKCKTSFAMTEKDLGKGRGRRLECGTCGHSWFQSRDRLMSLRESFELVPLTENDKNRIKLNLEEGKHPNFMGETKLYVGNISFGSSEEDLYELFSEIGTVGEVSLVRDDIGRIRGFGFVTMRAKADGEKAIEVLDGTDFNGRNLAVRESNN